MTISKINSDYCCYLVQQVREKRRKNRVRDLFLAGNVLIHTIQQSAATVEVWGLIMLSHLPFSLDLAPLDILNTHSEERGFTQKRFKEDLKEGNGKFSTKKYLNSLNPLSMN